jgi:hypothetical protein
MTLRRSSGMLTLLAMVHFIIVGTATVCATPTGDGRAAVSAHANCAPASSHSKGGNADRPAEVPCCTALASCATAPIAARSSALAVAAPALLVASALAERAPRAEIPAPELPPPKA